MVGGDLVVHRDASGGWDGVSQTVAAPLTVGTDTRDREDRGHADRPGPQRPHRRRPRRRPRRGASSSSSTPPGPRRASRGRSSPAAPRPTAPPRRLATYVDARTGMVIRSEEQVVNVDGQGQTLYSGTVPLQVSGSGTSYTLKDATRGGTYTTDMKNAEDSIFCQIFGAGCSTGTTFTSTSTTFGNGQTSNRASAGADAQYGSDVTWDYFKAVHGRNGISERRPRLLQPGPLRQRLRQRVLGRQQDDVRRRRRRRLRAAGLARRRRPRDDPRRDRELREPDLLRGVRRPQRGDLRHLRHAGRVPRGQRQRPGRLPHRRGVRPQGARRLPPDGPPVVRRQLARLLEQHRQGRRRALLLRHRQPLLLPARRGHAARRRSAA